MYSFQTQLKIGEAHELTLDEYFSHLFDITRASKEQQKNGIDRVFIGRDTGRIYLVEYKSDIKASETKNAFIETISVAEKKKLGWTLTSQADILIYYIPGDKMAFVVPMKRIKDSLEEWKKYKKRRVKNVGYSAYGLTVPLWEIELIAIQIIYL